MFQNIENDELTFPDEAGVSLSGECKDLLQRLLTKEPSKRLGSLGGVAEIKLHPFFGGVDWLKLSDRTAPAPPAYLSEMALDIIAKQPFMLKDHPKVHGDCCQAGHPMYVDGWELNMTAMDVSQHKMQQL